MKSMFKLPLVAVAFAMAIPFSQAQEAATPPAPPPPPPPGEHGGKHKEGPHMDHLKMLTEKLSLTQEQQTQIKPILDARKKEMDAVREDAALDKDAKWAKAAEIFKAYQPKIRAVLTPEQQKKFDEMKERGPGAPHKEKAQEKAKE